MSEKKKPSIRFRGFTEDWEQRKLGDSCKLNGRIGFRGYTEKDIVTKEAGGVLTFSPTNIVDNKLTIECKNTYITREKYDESPEIKIFNGDILFVKTGSTLGKSALVTGLEEDASINPQIVVMRVEKDTEIFMSNVLITDGIMKQVAAAKIGGAVPTMTETELKNFTYFAPIEKEEKKKIGNYFSNLDHLITLHQREFEKLKNIKRSMLEKMFPQNGSSYPEIRFKGFTEAWEQRKSIDIADYSKGNGYSKGDLTDAGTPIILYGRLYTKYQFSISEVDTFAVPRNGAVYSQGNEVIVPASGETAEDIARASAVEKSGVLLGGDLNILRPFDFMNPLFLALAISNGEPQKELAKKAQGKSVVHIHNSDIQEVTIAYPSRTEQDRIVSVFRQLDHLITLHQRELEKLQNIKKSMLEKMLV